MYIQALCNLSNMGDAIVHRESERTMDRAGYCLVFLLVYVKKLKQTYLNEVNGSACKVLSEALAKVSGS